MNRREIHSTPTTGLVELARAHVMETSISDPETPAILRRIACAPLRLHETGLCDHEDSLPDAATSEPGFVLVEFELRPGVRSYRLAKVPKNVMWRVRLGFVERAVHRTLVVLARRLVRFCVAPAVLLPAPNARAADH